MSIEERGNENTEQNPVQHLIAERDLTNLVQQYGRYLQRYFLINGVPRDDVNDLVQDTFTVIWARRGQYDPQKARSFLHGTARNIMLAHNRKRYTRRQMQDRGLEVITQNVHPETEANKSPTHVFAGEERYRNLTSAIKKLPYPLADILFLRYLEGHNREQAAKILSISPGKLYRKERRALEVLRQSLLG